DHDYMIANCKRWKGRKTGKIRCVNYMDADSANVETNRDSHPNCAINIPLSAPITFLMPISLPLALALAVTKLIKLMQDTTRINSPIHARLVTKEMCPPMAFPFS